MSDNTTPSEPRDIELKLVEIPLPPAIIDVMGAAKSFYAYDDGDTTYCIRLVVPRSSFSNIFKEIPVTVECGTWDHEGKSFKPAPRKDSKERYTLSGVYDGPVGESSLTLRVHPV